MLAGTPHTQDTHSHRPVHCRSLSHKATAADDTQPHAPHHLCQNPKRTPPIYYHIPQSRRSKGQPTQGKLKGSCLHCCRCPPQAHWGLLYCLYCMAEVGWAVRYPPMYCRAVDVGCVVWVRVLPGWVPEAMHAAPHHSRTAQGCLHHRGASCDIHHAPGIIHLVPYCMDHTPYINASMQSVRCA